MGQERSSMQRMLDSTIALLQQHGAGAITVDAVLAHSGAPRGSVYHHFPGGRNELILAAVRQAGEEMSAAVEHACQEGPPLRALQRFAALWEHTLASADFNAGCAVAAAAIDNRQDMPEAAEAVRAIFTRWQVAIADLLARSGYDPGRAQRLATLVVSTIEGAVILCRVHGSALPLHDVITELTPLLA
jgi:TetR/AcrR family transcriptional regulator, lmrAB and yxaGH operons repressor